MYIFVSKDLIAQAIKMTKKKMKQRFLDSMIEINIYKELCDCV